MDPSTRHSGERGFSLIEVIVSVGLLAVVSLSVAQLFAAATEATLSAREQTTTAILASQKMEQLRGLTWGFEPESRLPVSDTTTDLTVDPPSPGGRGLSPSPAGVLTTSLPGYVDYLDAQGGWIGRGVDPPGGHLLHPTLVNHAASGESGTDPHPAGARHDPSTRVAACPGRASRPAAG